MPVIAESPPLIFGATPAPVGTPVITPTPRVPLTAFVERHGKFIESVDRLGVCFKREDLVGFSDQEFTDHSQIAMQDKYITKERDMYCSMKGIDILTKSLDRLAGR